MPRKHTLQSENSAVTHDRTAPTTPSLGYVGLAVTLPLLGHATWHAYRAVIRE